MHGLKVSRLTALVAVLMAALMVGVPSFIMGNDSLSPVGEAAAADPSRDFILGVVAMTVATLNPSTSTMVTEAMIIYPLYSYLIQWDESGEKVIGDLAKSWWVSPDGLTYEFELVDTANWVYYDHDLEEIVDTGQQVTSDDVKWSIDTVAAEKNSRLNFLWPTIDGLNLIEDTWCNSTTHFGIRIRQPYVDYQGSLMGNPILPRYIWENENFLNFDNLNPVGSGPFVYKTDGLPDAGYARLARNPYWHGETSYGWQIHVDEFVMRRYDDLSTLWTAVQLGTEGTNDGVDAMMGVSPAEFKATFGEEAPPCDNMVGFHQANGFVYEFNLNQMTDENRKLWGGSYTKGDNNQLLLDPVVKKGITMCVNRSYLIERYLEGYGVWTNTLVPYQNAMSHNYGEDGHDCILDPGASPPAAPDPFDPAAARALLMADGWKYDAGGALAGPTQCPLYGYVDGDLEPLEFDMVTPSSVDTYELMSRDIVGWCRDAGVNLKLEVLDNNVMNSLWYAADYDIWLWNWVLTPPTGEAVTGMIYLYTSYAVPADSDVYLADPVIDALYDEAIQEMDFNTRKEMAYDLQDLCYLNRGCQALAFREDLYAFNTDCWENFGELNTTYYLLPDVWPTWLCMNMNPVGNSAPSIDQITVTPPDGYDDCVVGEPVSFVGVNILDDKQNAADLEYRWIWGFGGESEADSWSDGIAASHTFTEDGVYTVTLVAKETAAVNGFEDYLSGFKTVEVVVHDYSNSLPHSLSIEMTPESPTAGEEVTFTGSAVDDEDDTLYYSWDFGDGTSGLGAAVTHKFLAQGYYTVTLKVDDRRYGAVPRPAESDIFPYISENGPPWITVPDFGEVTVKTDREFVIVAGDPNPRDNLEYTWDWGDGTTDVTTTMSAVHSYNWRGDYTITVSVDDGTGLPGHTDSDSGNVYVVQEANAVPTITEFIVDRDSISLGETIEFSATAADGDGDPLRFTFEFGDGTTHEESFAGTGPNDPVESTVLKTYSAVGDYSAYVYVYDGMTTNTSGVIGISVASNAAPIIEEFSPAQYWDTGVSMSFYCSADDYDGDTLTYTWDWGDGTPDTVIVGSGSATHTFAISGTYTVTVVVDDGKGLSDSADADVTVNRIPVIDSGLTVKSVDEDESEDYSVTAHDPDGDPLTYMWDFGDGTIVIGSASTVSHTYADQGTYTYRVYVWDAFVQYRSTHNVTSSSTVYVGSATEDDPPVIEPIPDIYAVEGEEVEIMVSASDDGGWEALVFTWDFDDGSALLVGDPPVYHVWASDGEFTLTVWVYDGSGILANNVSATADVYIENDDPPVADAGGDKEWAEDVPLELTAEASDDDIAVVGYEWTVEDTDGDHMYYVETFEYTWETPGSYLVELVVEDSIGQLSEPDVITVTITDETPPTGVSAGPDQTVHNGTTVDFSGAGVDNYDTDLNYTWSFVYSGAMRYLYGPTPEFTFSIISGYTVTLRVTDDAGNFATDQMIVTVEDQMPPVADAGADQEVDAETTVEFDGSGSYDDDTSIVSYTWEFEYDGATETLDGVSPTFDFDIADVYVVTLTVEDEGGNTATDTVTITVNDIGANVAPVADAGDDKDVTVGDLIYLDASGSDDSDGTIENWTWTFTYDGEPEELFGENVSFTFDIVGTYPVTLTVRDDDGATDTDTMTVTVEDLSPPVNEPPVANAGTDKTATVGDEVTFNGAGSSDDVAVVNYTWTFTYDGTPVTLYGVSPKHTFEIAGTYTVTLTVRDAEGETDTDTVVVTVEEEDEEVTDDEKSFLEAYGLPLGLAIALIVAALVAFFVLKGRKGGKPEGEKLEGMSAGEPEVPPPDQS
jgi:ABC-type transport system substrate-binding protein/PKD repeat protein